MKPLKGYFIAKVQEKKTKLAVLEGDVSNKRIVVEITHPETKEIKKGDEVVLASSASIMGIKDDKGEELLIIPVSAVCAVR